MANSPPPYYRLGMSDGSGQGSSSATQTPIDLVQQGYEEGVAAAQAGGPGGPPGTLSYDSGVNGLQFGPGAPLADKTIIFTTQEDGQAYVVRIAHTSVGGTPGIDPAPAGFEIVSYTREGRTVTLDPPYSCSGPNFDFVVAVDQPNLGGQTTITVTYRAVYVGGDVSMDVYAYNGGNGNLIEKITAQADLNDGFIAAAASTPGVIGVWVPAYLPNGNLGPGAIAMEDILGSEPNLIVRHDGNNFAQIIDSPAGFVAPSLAKEIDITRLPLGHSFNCLTMASALSEDVWGGFFVFRMAATGGSKTQMVFSLGGTQAGAPAGTVAAVETGFGDVRIKREDDAGNGTQIFTMGSLNLYVASYANEGSDLHRFKVSLPGGGYGAVANVTRTISGSARQKGFTFGSKFSGTFIPYDPNWSLIAIVLFGTAPATPRAYPSDADLQDLFNAVA